MSEQRGLHNPDTHGTTSDGEPYCESCGVCDEGWRCRCCLAAEVEALRGENKALKYMVERDTAAIQRVRDVCDLWQRRHDSSIRHPADIPAVAIVAVLRALDGDGDA